MKDHYKKNVRWTLLVAVSTFAHCCTSLSMRRGQVPEGRLIIMRMLLVVARAAVGVCSMGPKGLVEQQSTGPFGHGADDTVSAPPYTIGDRHIGHRPPSWGWRIILTTQA